MYSYINGMSYDNHLVINNYHFCDFYSMMHHERVLGIKVLFYQAYGAQESHIKQRLIVYNGITKMTF